MEIKKQTEGIIYIGNKKPFMNYVTALIMELSKNPGKPVKVVARGKIILRAVDVVRVVRNKNKEVKLIETILDSERMDVKDKDGKDAKRDVSIIEIVLKKE